MAVGDLLAKNVRRLRQRAGLSQQKLAERSGLSVRYLSRLENTSPNVTIDVLERIAKGLECPIGTLVTDEGAKPADKKIVESLDRVIADLIKVRCRL